MWSSSGVSASATRPTASTTVRRSRSTAHRRRCGRQGRTSATVGVRGPATRPPGRDEPAGRRASCHEQPLVVQHAMPAVVGGELQDDPACPPTDQRPRLVGQLRLNTGDRGALGRVAAQPQLREADVAEVRQLVGGAGSGQSVAGLHDLHVTDGVCAQVEQQAELVVLRHVQRSGQSTAAGLPLRQEPREVRRGPHRSLGRGGAHRQRGRHRVPAVPLDVGERDVLADAPHPTGELAGLVHVGHGELGSSWRRSGTPPWGPWPGRWATAPRRPLTAAAAGAASPPAAGR